MFNPLAFNVIIDIVELDLGLPFPSHFLFVPENISYVPFRKVT